MSRVRFATARALYETFPEVAEQIKIAPTDQFPIEFLKNLVSKGKLDEAVAFCAYLLPRREAVWWACTCARASLGEIPRDRGACVLAAEAWVYDPDDAHRKAALEIGAASDSNDPLTWLALAAGWSGGLLVTFPSLPVPVPTYMTARAARIAVLLSAAKAGKDQRPARLQACIEDGIKLAETGL
jgi:hypothetical protein